MSVAAQPCSCCCPRSITSNEDKFYTDWEESFDSFDQMGLHENLLRGIYAYGKTTAGCRYSTCRGSAAGAAADTRRPAP